MSVHTQLAIAMNALKDIAMIEHPLRGSYTKLSKAIKTADQAIDKVLAEAVADALHQEFPEEA